MTDRAEQFGEPHALELTDSFASRASRQRLEDFLVDVEGRKAVLSPLSELLIPTGSR